MFITRHAAVLGLRSCFIAAIALLLAISPGFGQPLDSTATAKLGIQVDLARQLAADPAIVAAVKSHNDQVPASSAAMTRERWKTLSVLDPAVRGFTKNAAAEFLKARKSSIVSEAFLSGADGLKIAFITKPSNFSHKGQPKHEEPMAGKLWKGEPEMDDSTGSQQIQFAVPVFDGDKPIGSLVIGIPVSRLKN